MAHSRGFEPLTARFVAGYSIQLSYECVVVFLDQITAGFFNHPTLYQLIENGALERIRTSDRPVRSRVLYPAELRVRCGREL